LGDGGLAHASVAFTIEAKAGGSICTRMTPTIEKLMFTRDEHFHEVWSEGTTRTNLKGCLGVALYAEGVANGDVEERVNDEGRTMAFKSTY
jgi:hypothetical protein